MTTPTTNTSPPGWGGGVKLFHWVIAALIFAAITIAILAGHWDDLGGSRKQQYWLFMLHKSLGLSVLALAVFRLLWRVTQARPASLATHSTFEKKAATTAHLSLYLLLFALPLSGWWLNSVAGVPLKYFLLFNVPMLSTANPAMEKLASDTHEILGIVLLVILLAHIAGALKHHWWDKDSTLKRMLPTGKAGIATAAAIGALIAGMAITFTATKFAEQKIEPATEKPTVANQTTQQDGNWKLSSDSKLSFTVDVLGRKVEGLFQRFIADVNFDPSLLDNSSISATIHTESIFTDNSTRDEMLPEADWFAVQEHSLAQFLAYNIKQVADGQYTADAELTIREITHAIQFPFTWEQTENSATLSANVELKRLDYKLGATEFADADTIAHTVPVTVLLKLER